MISQFQIRVRSNENWNLDSEKNGTQKLKTFVSLQDTLSNFKFAFDRTKIGIWILPSLTKYIIVFI
jgi:hypothetical protein